MSGGNEYIMDLNPVVATLQCHSKICQHKWCHLCVPVKIVSLFQTTITLLLGRIVCSCIMCRVLTFFSAILFHTVPIPLAI